VSWIHGLSWWQAVAVCGTIALAAWGLRLTLQDFFLDRFGDVLSDRLKRWDNRPDAPEPTDSSGVADR